MRRLLLGVTASVFLALLAGFFVVGAVFHWSFTQRFERALPPQVRVATSAISVLVETAGPEHRAQALAQLAQESRARVEALPRAQLPAVPEHVETRLAEGQPALDRTSDGARLFVPVDKGRTIIVLNSDIEVPVPSAAALALAVCAVMVIVFATGVALVLPFVRRMRRLEQTVEQIAAGDLSARSEDLGKDVVGTFAKGFNSMADRVQELLENQRQLLQAVAHELRTPTARVRFGLEMLASAPSEDVRAARLESIDDDLEEIDELVRELQFFNKADVGHVLVRSDEALGALVNEVVDGVRHLRKDIAMRVEACSTCHAQIDARAAKRAIQNLVINALRYAEHEVVVRCRADQATDQVVIEVIDDGPGVPENERVRILEPFARVDDSRNKASGGVGLGLAIVDRVMRAHNGSITVCEAVGGGARFVLRWPAAP